MKKKGLLHTSAFPTIVQERHGANRTHRKDGQGGFLSVMRPYGCPLPEGNGHLGVRAL